MKVVILGCGKMGQELTRSLVKEGHDVTVIDHDESVVGTIGDLYDVMTVCGEGVDYDTLSEAQVQDARLFIAMTPRDEVNILSCFLAKRMGAHHTIARIEDTDMTDRELSFIKQQTNISMFVNPALIVAQELNNMLRLPSGIRADYFARHSFEMVELRTKMNSTFSNMNVSDLRRHFKENFLICAVGRGSDVYIPRGDFVLRDGDLLTINAAPTEIDKLLTEVGYINKPVRNVMIIGGSRTAYQLGKILIESGIRVKIIEQDRDRCRQLCESLPEAVVINGDGAQGELLNEEGLLTTDAFVSLTGMDEENILMCIYANEQRVPRAMCKVDRSAFADLAGRLGVEGLVSPNVRVSSLVLRYVRALENSAGSNIETLYKLMDGRAEAMEFIVKPDFPYLNIPLYQLEFKPGMLIGGIIRDTKPLIPGGNDHIEAKDRVIVLAAGQNLVSLSDAIIKVKES